MQSVNQCVLITGASSGIGAVLATNLVAEGYRVIGTARSSDRLNELADKLGSAFLPLELDLNNPDIASMLTRALPDSWQQIDVLINNAGHDVGGRKPFAEGKLEHWLDIIETNLKGLLAVTYAVLPGMLQRDHGHIVNIGSTSGLEPVATTAVYSASKHGVNGFSESLRKELEQTGVRVSQILPGMVRTGFAAARFGDRQRAEQFYDDFGKWLEPEDVAGAVIYALKQPAHVVISQLVIVPKPITAK
jgi:3-hydroxy acid dehydrogenase/malonic semialdehyde reductase